MRMLVGVNRRNTESPTPKKIESHQVHWIIIWWGGVRNWSNLYAATTMPDNARRIIDKEQSSLSKIN